MPASNCSGCSYKNHKFNPSTSSTFKNLGVDGELHYGKGNAFGFYGEDTIRFNDLSVYDNFLIVDR